MPVVRTGIALLATLQWSFTPAWAASEDPAEPARANVIVSVETKSGEPIPRAKIELIDASGSVVASDVTDTAGRYRIECVAVGQYRVRMSPPTDAYWGQTVVMPVGARGARLAWQVAEEKPPLAVATADGGACGAAADAEIAEGEAGADGTGDAAEDPSFLKAYWPWLAGGTVAAAGLIIGLTVGGGGGGGGGGGSRPQTPSQ